MNVDKTEMINYHDLNDTLPSPLPVGIFTSLNSLKILSTRDNELLREVFL